MICVFGFQNYDTGRLSYWGQSLHYPLGLPNVPRAPSANLGDMPALVFWDEFFIETLRIMSSYKSKHKKNQAELWIWRVGMTSQVNSGWFWKTCTIQRAMFHEASRVGAGRDCSRYLAQIPKAQKSMPCNFWFGFIFFTKEMLCFKFKSFWAHAECHGKVPELSCETESPETERGNVYLRHRPSTPTLDTYSSFPVLAAP